MYFNIKCIGKLPGPTNEFERSQVFETDEFERPKFDCINYSKDKVDFINLMMLIFLRIAFNFCSRLLCQYIPVKF